MQALGLIETRGLLPAIEGADVMLKTAQVKLLERIFVGGGLVTIAVTGEVGAVKVAVEAGVAAVEKFGRLSLVSHHVIARPHEGIDGMVAGRTEPSPDGERAVSAVTAAEECPDTVQVTLTRFGKEDVDAIFERFGLDKGVEALKSLPVAKLRALAREYKELGIAGRTISKANKNLLIQMLGDLYGRVNKT